MSRRLRSLALGWVAALAWSVDAAALAAPGAGVAQDAERRVDVRVTEVLAGVVYLDRGRADGLRIDDVVRLSPPGGLPLEASIESVAASSARARILPPGEAPPAGTPGEALVPASRFAAEAPPAGDATVDPGAPTRPATPPELSAPDGPAPHPPWREDAEPWDPERPLLAEPAGSSPAQREPWVFGRVRLRLDAASSGDSPVEHARASVGVDLTATNPFGRGGELELDAEALWRAYAADVEEDEDFVGRVDRLSWRVGGDRERPTELAVGRFSQRALPRLGRLDGVELRHRDGSGRVWGTSLGFVPALTTSATPLDADELQIAASVEQPLGGGDLGALTLGVQKTWYEGRSDRDLVVGALHLRPGRWSVRADALVDYDASSTASADAGFALTEYGLYADRPLGERFGVGVFASRYSLPDLLRNEVLGPPQLLGANDPLDRRGARGWWQVDSTWRVDARLERFEDSGTEGGGAGGGGELRASARDLGARRLHLSAAVRAMDTRYNDQLGLSVDARLPVGAGTLRAGYSFLAFEPVGLQAGLADRDQHHLRLGADLALAGGWTLSADLGQVVGDDADATVAALVASVRF